MPQAVICLDCNRLFSRRVDIRDHSRCPACLPAHLQRRSANRGQHLDTPKRRATRAFTASTEWRNVAKQVRLRDGACQACGTTRDLTVHHIRGIHDAPELRYDPDNLTTLCRSCHAREANTQARARTRARARARD